MVVHEIGPLTRKIYKAVKEFRQITHIVVSHTEWHQLLKENVANDAFCVVPNLPVCASGYAVAYLNEIKIIRDSVKIPSDATTT